jgi:hypothetical protein
MAKKLYTEAGDKKIDAKLMKRLTPAQIKAFKKMDEKHSKAKYQSEDTAMDKKIIKKIKAKTNGKKSKNKNKRG